MPKMSSYTLVGGWQSEKFSFSVCLAHIEIDAIEKRVIQSKEGKNENLFPTLASEKLKEITSFLSSSGFKCLFFGFSSSSSPILIIMETR